ncbi:alpha/beta hydrolase [Streptomyces sp. RTd22]|uniref:alpha/beta hydrolase n=1 Tax=Streptomyces sp. RTd22 TaxID=1841249 RepID=UPI0007C46AF9|nr:alpha/beta hydrolase [Streptomyces sp. RTd22]
MTTAPTALHRWQPPTGILPRGTLLVLPGRGEHGGTYERFGRRLAADGYVVHALDTAPEHTAHEVLTRAVATGENPVAPLVVVGSDTGALQALHAAATTDAPLTPTGLILAGTAPTTDGPAPTADLTGTDEDRGWDAELAARTACPTHRKKITGDREFARGRLFDPVPAHLLPDARPDLPVLVLHGEADPISPLEQARGLVERLPQATLGVLHEGVHDVLNDATHRTTAATIVLWLERLRADKAMRPLLTLETGRREAA